MLFRGIIQIKYETFWIEHDMIQNNINNAIHISRFCSLSVNSPFDDLSLYNYILHIGFTRVT